MYNPEANDNTLLSEFLEGKVGSEIGLMVYNMVRQETREVKITPRQGKNTRERLGADVKFEKFDDIHEKVFKVTDIKNNSPA